MKSKILVFIQFATIFILTLSIGTPTKHFELGILFIIMGLIIGLMALKKNSLKNINIRPDIKEDCTLVTDGIYAYIRHPMYSSVLVSSFGLTLIYLNPFNTVVYAVLLVNMLIKMFYEESLWHCHSDEYLKYKQTTHRLIPKIF